MDPLPIASLLLWSRHIKRRSCVGIKYQLDATDDFYCRSYCLLNMFRARLCPSSGARECYTGGCCLWYLVLWFSRCRYGVELRIMCPSAPHHTDKMKTKAPDTTGSNHLYNTFEFLMMGIVVPETCWVNNKNCNKNRLLHLVGILFPHISTDLNMFEIHYRNCKLYFAIVFILLVILFYIVN